MNGNKPAARANPYHYFIIYKPFGVLSQFSDEGKNPGLGSIFPLPKGVYPVGRLDADSEGLLLLTSDIRLNNLLLNPRHEHWRTYWVQVEGEIKAEALEMLSQGIHIRIDKKDYKTLPARAGVLPEPVALPERNPPIRYRQSIPTSWIFLKLREGKNRQVRRMTAAAGFPTLRLLRVAIEDLTLDGLQPGEMRELSEQEIYRLLKLNNIKASPSDASSQAGKPFRRKPGRK